MSIFGELDTDEVPEDPFFIENGTYRWIVTKNNWKTIKPTDGSPEFTMANYTLAVDELDSPYHGKTVQQGFRVYLDLTREEFEAMEVEDQVKVKEAMSRHKQFLRGLGFSEGEMTELNADNTADRCVGCQVVAEYKLGKSADGSKTYRNLNNVRPVEEDEPEDTSTVLGSLL